MKFHALIQGGTGEDCWDREVPINHAADIVDAAGLARAKAEEIGGEVTQVMVAEYSLADWWIIDRLREVLEALNHRVHSGYDFNADPDKMTLKVSEILAKAKHERAANP